MPNLINKTHIGRSTLWQPRGFSLSLMSKENFFRATIHVGRGWGYARHKEKTKQNKNKNTLYTNACFWWVAVSVVFLFFTVAEYNIKQVMLFKHISSICQYSLFCV